MDSAGFIPVEDQASVVASIQRLYPGADSYYLITFGQFQKACEFLADRSQAFDEDFILKLDVIDPKLEHTTITKTHKSVSDDGNDWISSFLEALSPFAGLIIAGKMMQLYSSFAPEEGVDSNGAFGESRSQGLIAAPIAIALLIELGLSVIEYKKLYGKNTPTHIDQHFDELSNDPAKREKILTEAGYDYSALRANQKFNDHRAIKEYALRYISIHSDQLNYDHWISYSHVVDSQILVRSAAAMAPTFSGKWRQYYGLGNNEVTTETQIFESNSTINGPLAVTLNNALAGYLSSLNLNISGSYDGIYQALSYRVDPHLICCLVWFLGPMSLDTLKKISQVLRLSTLQINGEFGDFFSYLAESTSTILLSMMSYYLSVILDRLLHALYEKIFALTDNDILDALKICLGFEIVLNGIAYALNSVLRFLEDLFDQLRALLNKLVNKSKTTANLIVERRGMYSIIKLIEAVIAQADTIQHICPVDNKDNTNQFANQDITDRTLDFVAINLPNLYPVLDMPESDRRKHFSEIKPVTLSRLGFEIPGTDENGQPDVFIKKPAECGSESAAVKGVTLGQRLADKLKGTI